MWTEGRATASAAPGASPGLEWPFRVVPRWLTWPGPFIPPPSAAESGPPREGDLRLGSSWHRAGGIEICLLTALLGHGGGRSPSGQGQGQASDQTVPCVSQRAQHTPFALNVHLLESVRRAGTLGARQG